MRGNTSERIGTTGTRTVVCVLAAIMLAAAAAVIIISEHGDANDEVLGAAGDYNAGDIEAVNDIIDNNGLSWTPAVPADGSYVPSGWTGVTWSGSDGDTDRRMIKLNLSPMGLHGILDVSGMTELTELICSYDDLSGIDLTGAAKLTRLYCNGNVITELDLTDCISLTELNCSDNRLTELDLTGPNNLTMMYCSSNELTELDLTGMSALMLAGCAGNAISKLTLSGCASLTSLDCQGNRLTELDLSGCPALRILFCQNNELAELDVTCLAGLTQFYCQNNELTGLDVTGITGLIKMNCSGNHLAGTEDVKGFTGGWDGTNFRFEPQNTLPLSFVHDAAFDIPASTVGTPIDDIDVSGGVSGGKRPYAFAAVGLPNGVTISEAGVISGTPSSKSYAGTATVVVIDANGEKRSITISYGKMTKPDSGSDMIFIEVLLLLMVVLILYVLLGRKSI